MNQSPTGNAIGNDTIGLADDGTVLTPGQVQFGRDYLAAHISAQKPFLTDAENLELALGMAKLAGNAIITHVPGWDRVTTAPNVSPGLDRPIPAVAQQEDGQGSFMALWWKIGPAPTAWRRIDAGAVPAFPGFYRGPMKQIGADDPGNSGLVADGSHSHPAADPAVVGSYLFTARKSNPKLRKPVRGLMPHGEGIGFESNWTQIAGVSTWQAKTNGYLTVAVSGGIGLPPVAASSDRLFAYSEVPFGNDAAHYGIYEVLDPGGADHRAVIRRASDANTPETLCHGMLLQVTGSGVEYEGYYFRLTTSDPISVDGTSLSFEELSSYTPTSSYELLTAAQLVTEPADSDSLDLACSQSFGGDMPFPQAFLTIPGTPGLTAIPAGMQSFRVEQVGVGTATNSGVVKLKLRAYIMEADGATIVGTAFTAESPPLPLESTSYPLEFQYNLAAPVTLTSAQRLLLMPILSTDITQLVTLTIRYNSASHGTWWHTTMQFAALGGTNNHLDLLNTAQDVAKGQSPDHPWCAIGPAGRIHTKIGIGTAANGLLDMPADCSSCEVEMPTADFAGINTDGFLPGDVIRVTVTNASTSTPKTLRHGQTPAAPYKGLVLAKDTMSSYQPIVLKNSPARMAFQLSRAGDCWHLVERPIA